MYEKLRSELVDAAERMTPLGVVLKAAPPDFGYPRSALQPTLRTTGPHRGPPRGRRGTRRSTARSEFDGPARLGNFQPLMSQARDLLDEPRGALTQLLANVLSLENAVAEYRKRLVENIAAYRGLEALAVRGSGSPLSADAQGRRGGRRAPRGAAASQAACAGASVMGSSRLSDTPVSFDRWCAIVRALDAGRDPALEPQEADALVKRNIVERTYRLGVKS
ncbi:MAG: hypothetical protein IPN77_03635 [Sandaracinaceae bacterium]|nr:hypothetical protein [Sandaracinaceae bacterium]